MTTVGKFIHQAEASLALSRLQAAGIEGFLFDEISLAVVGAGTTAIPIRLEVSDEDAEKAGRILRGEEGARPLADDFVPPEGTEVVEGNFPKVTAKEVGSAFIKGGILTLITVGLPGLAAVVGGGMRAPTIGDLLLLFVIGGVGGAVMHVCHEGEKKSREAEEDSCSDSDPPDKPVNRH
ncbi:MAG: DUF2007 domain-containing protein [Verrucomicrobia bacterium]|nr:DUF2007 domain-containing protein [Verrucomicrobiota bacterium]